MLFKIVRVLASEILFRIDVIVGTVLILVMQEHRTKRIGNIKVFKTKKTAIAIIGDWMTLSPVYVSQDCCRFLYNFDHISPRIKLWRLFSSYSYVVTLVFEMK